MKVPIIFEIEGFIIRGIFFLAAGESPFRTVLLLQGFPGDEGDILGLGQNLSENNINALTFNYRGTFQSEGTFSLRNTLQDISAGIDYLHQESVIDRFRIDTSKLVLGGYSYGGGMGLVFAASHPEIKRIFSISGTDHGEFARQYQRNPAFAEMIDTSFEGLKSPAGPVRFADKSKFDELIQNPGPYDLRLKAKILADRDILLLGGWNDINVSIEGHLLPFYRTLKELDAKAVQIEAFPDDHGFESSEDQLAAVVVDWIKSG